MTMRKIVIIVGHSQKDTFCEVLATAYRNSARAGGHEARMYVLSKMLFDPVLYEGFSKVQPLEPDLKAAHDAIFGADHLVFVVPLWLGDMPAILKGFLERVFQPDLVEPARNGAFIKLLKGKSARVVVTMGMPGLVYRWYFGSHAVKLLKRNILGFLGASPIRSEVIGNIAGLGDAGRKAWLAKVEAWGRAGA
jgi:putative NADPH-quinone reductase